MILPIVAYGHPVLKAVAKDIDKDFPELEKLLADMWETLAHSEGVGLAAPQVNQSIRLFLVDARPFYPDYPDAKTTTRSSSTPSCSRPLATRSPSRRAASACRASTRM